MWGFSRPKTEPRSDIILLNDVSSSMSTPDWRPSRLAGAKKASTAFVENRARLFPDDRIGLVVFNERAVTILPPVPLSNREVIYRKIRSLWADGCTNIGQGLVAAERLLKPSTAESKAIILHTDGQDDDDSFALRVASRLKHIGVNIYAVGIGSRAEVNDDLLSSLASVINDQPAYRFIGDEETLVRHYNKLAETRLVHRGTVSL
jgi:Ca-activated chloride channel homolog